jgi:single-stranded DNA-specific DHH superfamily exonuclease
MLDGKVGGVALDKIAEAERQRKELKHANDRRVQLEKAELQRVQHEAKAKAGYYPSHTE